MELIIVRHGRPERVVGAAEAADPNLTDVGHQQAEATAEFLMGEQIDHIVSSPMARARQTAAPLAEKLGLTVQIVDGIAEMDRHSDSYIPEEEMKDHPEVWEQWQKDPLAIFGDSSPEEFQATVLAAMDSIIAEHRGKNVAVFCHGGTTMAFVNHALGIVNEGVDLLMTLSPSYCGISRVAANSKGLRTVRSSNETGHVRHLLPDRI